MYSDECVCGMCGMCGMWPIRFRSWYVLCWHRVVCVSVIILDGVMVVCWGTKEADELFVSGRKFFCMEKVC